MLKITQNKLQKTSGGSSSRPSQPAAADDTSFLKKLSRQYNEQQQTPNHLSQTSQGTTQYASRYAPASQQPSTVSSPKHKENMVVLASH